MKHKLQGIKEEAQQLTTEISSDLRRSAKKIQKVADGRGTYDYPKHVPVR